MALTTLGWVCQFNAIGVHWGYGADRDCSENADGKAAALDPDDISLVVDLAIAHEYDADGNRYAPGAHLDEAIAEYKVIRQKDQATADQYEDNLLWDLFFAKHYKELLADLDTPPASTSRNGFAIAAIVAEQGGDSGVKAGFDRADHLAGDANDRSAALADAGDHLVIVRMYPEAAAILSAAKNQSDYAHLMERASVFRTLTSWTAASCPKPIRAAWCRGSESPSPRAASTRNLQTPCFPATPMDRMRSGRG